MQGGTNGALQLDGTVTGLFLHAPKGPPFLAIKVSGQGTATVGLGSVGQNFGVFDVSYQFAAVPEPSTVMLLWIGLTTFLAWRHSYAKRR